MFCEFHAYPASEEKSAVFTPAAKQVVVVGQETDETRLVPEGGTSFVQESPPDDVLIIVVPAPPLFPLLPTATQSSRLEHEIPVTSTALEGAGCAVQLAPLFDVPIMKGVELKFVPVAMHCAPLGQSMASKLAPVGIELVGAQSVKSVVLNDVAFPAVLMPTATHVVVVAQKTEVKALTVGLVKMVHG